MEELSFSRIVGRDETSPFNSDILSELLMRERVLVTGAGGSIGSEIVRQLSKLNVQEILATDRDENSLHSLQLSIGGSALFLDQRIRVLDVRDRTGCENIFHQFQPTLVIHAAALKHLSALERQPREAFLTNVIGTQNVLECAERNNVHNLINISTDKAALPTSVLGKSKRLAEIITDQSAKRTGYNYKSVRFGNVFASKGSVIETFIYQIKNGLPITLTDPNITRYFMSVFEASSLVLQTLQLKDGGIYILDMGDPIKIELIIENLMTVLGKRVPVAITGLRKGEKIAESLLSHRESIKSSPLPKISNISWNGDEYPELHFRVQPQSDTDAVAFFDSIEF